MITKQGFQRLSIENKKELGWNWMTGKGEIASAPMTHRNDGIQFSPLYVEGN
ncbi:MAG: hypothetical protein M1381_10925 [Deltaproteobacteria bacterium]|nr:hypothetical protein [Deltaproteobacteria bacterium]